MAAVATMVAYALSATGYPVHHADLNDGGVWVSTNQTGEFGRMNKPIGQFDGYLFAPGGQQIAANLDILQDGSAVVGRDAGKGRLYPIDVTGMKIGSNSGVNVASGDGIGIGGGVLAVLDPSTGSIWATTYDPDQGLSSLAGLDSSAKPLAVVGANSGLAVGQDGTIYTASAKGLTTITRDGTSFAKPKLTSLGDSVAGVLSVTVVGTHPVVLAIEPGAQVGSLLQPGRRSVTVAGAGGAVLQQPGPDTSDVLLATRTALIAVSLDGGNLRSRFEGGGGAPAAPVQLGGCIFAAWAGAPGVYATSCGTGAPAASPISGTTSGLEFRVNRRQLMLNDLPSGKVYNVDSGTPQQLANWELLNPPPIQKSDKHKDRNKDTSARSAKPPKALDDTLGARPGRTTALYVLDNDSDPSGNILAVSSVSAPSNRAASLAISPDGQTVLITLPASASGDTIFKYVVGDGKNPTATATVTVHTRAIGQNAAPTTRKTFKARTWQVPAGGTITVPVLTDWRDYTDGDPVLLAGASAAHGSVTTTPDGQVIYTAPGTPGKQTVSYQVGDGMGATVTWPLVVVVEPANAAPTAATAEPDVARGEVGKPIVIHPLANDLPGSDPLDVTATMRLAGPLATPAGVSVQTDLARGSVTITAHRPSSYQLSYQVAYGNAPYGKGLIRFDATPAMAPKPPIAAPDVAVLHGQAPVVVDVLANDFDPAGNVLVVQHAAATSAGQLQVAILDGRWLRINALQKMSPATQIVRYTITDGVAGSVSGDVTVTQLAAPPSDTPVPQPDYATVRAGDSVTIPVLDNDTNPGGDPITLVKNVDRAPAPGQLTATPATGTAYVSGNVVRYIAPLLVTKPTQVKIAYFAQDPAGDQAQGTAIVTILPLPSATAPDRPPTPQPIEARVTAGDTISIKVPTSGIDPDGDSVTATGIGSAPTLGRIVSVGGSSVKYQAYPNVGNGGTDEFTYLVTDTFGQSGSSTIRIAVVPPGDPQPPVAVDDTITAAPGARVSVDVLANDLRTTGDKVTIVALDKTNPDRSSGSLESSTGPIDVTANPDPKSAKPVVVLYSITDGLGAPSQASLTVRSKVGVDIPPVAFDQFATPKPDATQISVNVLTGNRSAYDPDASSGGLRVVSPSAGVSGGRITLPVKKVPQVVPYVVKDSGGATAMAVIYIPAIGGGAPYVKADQSIDMPVHSSKTVNIADYVVDPAGKPVRVTTGQEIWASPQAGVKIALGKDATHLTLTSLGSYSGPAAITFGVTDGKTITDPKGQRAVITVPVQVGSATPVLRCPVTVLQLVEGGAAVPIDVASVCHVWAPNASDVAKLTYKGDWKQRPDNVTLSGSGTSTLSVQALSGAKPGTTGVLMVGVSGTQAVLQQLRVAVIKAPTPTITPITIDGVKAGETRTLDIAGNVGSRLGTPVISVVGNPRQTSGMPASVTASGSSLTITPGKDSRGTMTFSVVVTDVTDKSRLDRQVTGQITLHVLGHPGAPANVAPARSVQTHVVVVSWTAPENNGAPITYYQVDYGSGSQKCSASPCAITGLTNGTMYRFTVTAYNLVGPGPASAPSAPGEPNAVPDAVTGFTTSNPQDGKLTLSWTPAHVDGSPVLSYQISWSGRTLQTGGSGATAVATGLINDNLTTFTIIAVNAKGPSAKTTVAGQSAGAPLPNPPAAPTFSAATDAAGTRAVTINWVAESPNGPGPTTYTVSRTDDRGGSKTVCTSVVALSCTDNGLKNDGTVYAYKYAAANAAAKLSATGHTTGASPGVSFEATGTPDPITNFTATPTGVNGQATLQFDAPASNGSSSTITCTANGTSCGSWVFPTGGQAGATKQISGLGNGQNTAISLQDCNGSKGIGGASAGSPCDAAVTTNVVTYGPIGNPAVAASASGTTVSWTVSVDPNGKPATVQVTSNHGFNQTYTTGVGPWSTTGGDNVGYSTTDTITITVSDTGRATTSASGSATTGPPPPPPSSVTVSKGAACSGATCSARTPTACTSSACGFIHVQTANFGGPVTCVFDSTTGNTGFVNQTYGPNQSSDSVNFYGYRNQTVTVTCGGVAGSFVWT